MIIKNVTNVTKNSTSDYFACFVSVWLFVRNRSLMKVVRIAFVEHWQAEGADIIHLYAAKLVTLHYPEQGCTEF